MSSNKSVQPDDQQHSQINSRIAELEAEIEELKHKAETQIDTISHTYSVSDYAYSQYYQKHGNTDIRWDDTGRPKKERQNDVEKGFLAESVLVEILEDKIGEDNVDWKGDNGESDIVVYDELRIEVKCRETETQRNLIIDEGKLNHDNVDIYVNSVLQKDERTDEPLAIEFLGFVSKEESLEKRILMNGTGKMYGYPDEEKYEVHPKYLRNIQTFLDTLKMFRAKPEQVQDAF